MKTKENIILQSLIFNSVLFLLLVFFASGFVYPSFASIEARKTEASDILTKYDNLKKQGLNYDEFNSIKSSFDLSNNTYLRNVLSDVDKSFYEANFVSKWDSNYKDFLNRKVSSTKQEKQKLEQNWDARVLAKILPYYTEDSTLVSEGTLNDFKFINYVESILESFNITTSSPIWIFDLTPLDDVQADPKKANSQKWANLLDSKIYYTEVPLEITWKKSNVLNFIYFAQNVWKLNLSNLWLEVYKDSFLQNQISWYWFDDNIYNNYVFDIKSLKLSDYPDSSLLPSSEWQNLLSFIYSSSDWQAHEKYSASIILRFYFKWMPDYKVKELVTKFVTKYKAVSGVVTSSISYFNVNKDKDSSYSAIRAYNKLKDFDKYLLSIKDSVFTLEKDSTKWINLTSNYEKIKSYELFVNRIIEELKVELPTIDKKLFEKNKNLFEENKNTK